jgi:hypothetical protein
MQQPKVAQEHMERCTQGRIGVYVRLATYPGDTTRRPPCSFTSCNIVQICLSVLLLLAINENGTQVLTGGAANEAGLRKGPRSSSC